MDASGPALTSSSFDFVVEPGRVLTFARSVGDLEPVYGRQLEAARGTPLVTPPTFVRSAELYDPGAMLLVRETDGLTSRSGGSTDTLHAEQEFEYFEPLCAGERIRVETRTGRTWSKEGRAGALHFFETITDYVNEAGRIAIRARKVSVQRLEADA